MVEFTKKYEGAADARVFMDVAGAVGTIRWVADYPDLATVDKVQAQVLADPEYWKAVAKAADLFIEGEVEDLLLREI